MKLLRPPKDPPETSVPVALEAHSIERALVETFHSPTYTPPLAPVVALELYKLAQRDDVDMNAMNALLKSDPLLAARVLRAAQTSAYATRSRITSLADATMRLGLRRLAEMFLETSMTMRVFRARGFEKIMDELRLHSLKVARIARALAPAANNPPEFAFLCALLHDVGFAAAVIVVADGQAKRIFPYMPIAQVLDIIEPIHAEASGIIGRLWNLPPEVVHVIEHHHPWLPGGAVVVPTSSLLMIANALSAPTHEHTANPAAVERAAKALGLSFDALDEIAETSAERLSFIP